ncbi:MAG: hypothetical protein ACJ77K_00240 [Bacteroidia bacterium]|jgi:hypothetical protein
MGPVLSTMALAKVHFIHQSFSEGGLSFNHSNSDWFTFPAGRLFRQEDRKDKNSGGEK